MRIFRVERIFVVDGKLSARLARRKFAPAHQRVGKLKAAIFYHLRVKPAVRAEVDVLKKNPPHRGIDFHAGLVGVDGNCGGAGVDREHAGGGQKYFEDGIFFHVVNFFMRNLCPQNLVLPPGIELGSTV